MDVILQILQWAIPAGGVGTAIAWLAHRNVMNAKDAKEVHDTYKVMYEDISTLLEKTQRKYEKTIEKSESLEHETQLTRRALNRLSRAIEAIQVCQYKQDCPVRTALKTTEE